MEIYKKTHKTKKGLNSHISKIKERGGVYQVMDINGRYNLEYSFPDNNKISLPILNQLKRSIKK